MLSILRDGILILYVYKEAILAFFITVCGLGYYAIKQTVHREWEDGIKLSVILGIGGVLLCLSSYLIIFLSHFWPLLLRPGSYAILFFAIFVLIKGLWSGDIKVSNPIWVVMGLMVVLLLCIRLAFLKYMILPPYSDSPIHYQIVFGLLHADASGLSKISFGSLLTNYYHLGFHALVAWLTAVTDLEPVNTISVLGQSLLVIAPLSVVFLVHTLIGDKAGALFAGFLAAVGWYMPAFAVNWGKFPAISSLAVLPSVIAFLCLYLRGETRKNVSLPVGLFLLMGIVLMHTRILICIFLIAICSFLAKKLPVDERLGYFQSVRYALLYILSLWPLQWFLADYYGLPATMIVFALLPFAFREFPRLALAIFLFTFGLELAVLAPPLFGAGYRALLDRQFLEMLFYIPLSTLGGAGFSAMLRIVPMTQVLRWLAIAIPVGLTMFNFSSHGAVYPDACCDYFKANDQLAFQWLQGQLGDHDLVLISAFDNEGQVLGTDAGVWIYPLIGRPTNKLPYDTDWTSSMEKVCEFGSDAVYIYMGGRPYSFNNAQLAQGDWIREVFKAGRTIIYQASGCKG